MDSPKETLGRELNKSDNPWIPPSEVAKHLSTEEKKTYKIICKFRGILNKLTPQKFGILIQQVLDLEIDTPEILEDVIHLLFETAISQPMYSVAYANLCRQLLHTNVKVETKDGKDTTLTFRKILLNKCQKEFEKEKSDEINIHEKMDELLKQGLSEEELKVKKEELDQEELKSRRRTLGNIRFIGELFKLKMLTESIMHDCVIKLLKSNDEESYECICKLLSTIGKDLDHPKAKPRMDQYFEQINKIIEAKKTSSRCRFMLMDLKDLRESNWVPRRDDNNPKTIDQIHKEAAEEKKKMMLIQQSKLHKRDGSGKGRDGPRTVVPKANEPWRRPRNVNVDPKKFQNVQKRTEGISLGPGGRVYGAWTHVTSTPTEEPRGNRFSALGDGRRGAGASRQSRSWRLRGRRPQSEREKALEAVRNVVQTKPQQQSKQDERQTVSPQQDDGEVESVASITRQPAASTPPPKELTEEEVKKKTKILESLASFASSSGPQPHSSKVQEELPNIFLIKLSSNEDIFKWIDDNVKNPKDPEFIRALVTVVCEACKKDSDDSCDTFAFKQRSPLLQKYIDNNSSLALHALFALQALSVRLDHPPGFLKSFFNALYDEEVIMEDAFFAWEEDKSPNESQGKGTAKSSTVHFFEWLRSAEEEKTDDS